MFPLLVFFLLQFKRFQWTRESDTGRWEQWFWFSIFFLELQATNKLVPGADCYIRTHPSLTIPSLDELDILYLFRQTRAAVVSHDVRGTGISRVALAGVHTVSRMTTAASLWGVHGRTGGFCDRNRRRHVSSGGSTSSLGYHAVSEGILWPLQLRISPSIRRGVCAGIAREVARSKYFLPKS